jgi:hypothetical protein
MSASGTTTQKEPETLVASDGGTQYPTELLLCVLSVSSCREFPKMPYMSTLLPATNTFIRRDGGTSPILPDCYRTEDSWRAAHASMCLEKRQEESQKYFQGLVRVKNAVFSLSEQLINYEQQLKAQDDLMTLQAQAQAQANTVTQEPPKKHSHTAHDHFQL